MTKNMEEVRQVAGIIHGLLQHDMDRAIERFATPPRAETADLHRRIMDAARRNGCRPWTWPHNQGPFLKELLAFTRKPYVGPGTWVHFDDTGRMSFSWGPQ